MDIYRLSTDIKFMNQIGMTLSVEERMKLELSILKINENENFDQILFWGKIQGVKADYFVALALQYKGKFEFPSKKFYFAKSDTFDFEELPECNLEYQQQVDTFRTLFTGDPKTVIIPLKEEEEAPPADANQEEIQEKAPVDSDEDENPKVKPKPFTESDRLAYIIRAIENDCSLVPVGALKLTPSHELRYNDSFKGLSLKEVNQISLYQHFRAPQTQEKKDFISRDDAIFHFNIFDPIHNDLPKGCWSLQTDSSKTNATLRSLTWPGFVGYHRANSRIFGYCYIGNGLKNCDLPFLL
ncbi:radial spoke head protein, putative [Ichthyophthirius multifiliis]|uniref:Radial spoke head protein 9 homolog n=1 Tax=Ichthyophthirius multifiliis TaxID=5932 RepID=G0QXY0_ICHMU|nr:radial spoke head protein, putative [Ichthyophthirius multifiliis]EGR29932.1 radial spoke head protein, putative [Ichthyophthirius multifiliis]|eukprot:XP_004031168.1 radial spoke head protein, putative [Ichthyophthirius multifiliis]